MRYLVEFCLQRLVNIKHCSLNSQWTTGCVPVPHNTQQHLWSALEHPRGKQSRSEWKLWMQPHHPAACRLPEASQVTDCLLGGSHVTVQQVSVECCLRAQVSPPGAQQSLNVGSPSLWKSQCCALCVKMSCLDLLQFQHSAD